MPYGWEQTLDKIEKHLRRIADYLERDPVRHGHWVFDDPLRGDFVCTNCLERSDICTEYCPHCGAHMDEVEDAEVHNQP